MRAAPEHAKGIATTKADVAAFFVRRHLVPGYDPTEDPSYLARIDAVLTEDPHADGADRAGRPDAIEAPPEARVGTERDLRLYAPTSGRPMMASWR